MRKLILTIIAIGFILTFISYSHSAIDKFSDPQLQKPDQIEEGPCEIKVQKWDISYVNNVMVIDSTLKNVTNVNLQGSYVFIHFMTEEGELISYSTYEIIQDFPVNGVISTFFIAEIQPGATTIFVLMTDSEGKHIYPTCADEE